MADLALIVKSSKLDIYKGDSIYDHQRKPYLCAGDC